MMDFDFNPLTGKMDLVNKAIESCSYTVPANSTENIDTIDNSDYLGLRYFISATGDSKFKNLDMTVYKRGGNINDMVSGRTPSDLQFSINAKDDSGDTVLEVVNNNAFEILFEFTKIINC